MKLPTTSYLGLTVLAGISLVSQASASVVIDWVTIADPGNAADPATGSLYGAVSYAYNIAKNETTISQYAEFLNAVAKTDTYGLYNTNMASSTYLGSLITRSGGSGSYSYTVASGRESLPVAYVSWFDAARFTNWLHNGQGTGSTETGAYTLNGATSGIFTKNVGATVWIPSESEWYKAAYYDPTKGGTGGYWLYANQSDSMTSNNIGLAGAANHYDGDFVGSGTSSLPSGNALTNVGAYGANSDSYYGTNEQSGNVWEWNDAVISGSERGTRGGSWDETETNQRASVKSNIDPTYEAFWVGFRVASVPEPSALVLSMLASAGIMIRRKR